MTRLLSIGSALAIILVTGLVHGFWTDRWSVSQDLERAVARIKAVPGSVGDWRGEPLELDRRMLEVAEIEGYSYRRFRHQRDGREVSVLLVCGRSGPIVRHTPDICYQGLGYSMSGEPATDLLTYGAGREAGIRSVEMRRDTPAASDALKIDWTWNAYGTWEAPANERTRFLTSRFLYKLYVLRPREPGEAGRDDATDREFLQQFLPALDQALFPRTSKATSK